jgi:hypothetical protein
MGLLQHDTAGIERVLTTVSDGVGLPSESGGNADISALTLSAISRREQVQQKSVFFDHLVSCHKQCLWDGEAEPLSPS